MEQVGKLKKVMLELKIIFVEYQEKRIECIVKSTNNNS
jgi:hypothetical protein